MCLHVLKNCIHHPVTDIMFLSRELKGHVDTDNVSTLLSKRFCWTGTIRTRFIKKKEKTNLHENFR